METLIVALLLALIGLVVFMLFKTEKSRNLDDKLQGVITEKLAGFQNNIQKTMDNARDAVERSKDVISGHAVETLKTIKDMGRTVEKIVEQHREAQELGNSLKYLLQTPKLRGNYGEEILEEMLERVTPTMWERQYNLGEGERVDAVVKYKNIIIPIDAKFPRETYEKYLNSESGEDKKRNWKLYEDVIKGQMNSIKGKYIKPDAGTSDFALMFIPSESIYYETMAEKNYAGEPCLIYEYARKSKVIPVSPNTFYIFLQIILLGVRNIDIMKNAKKLAEALEKIDKNFKQFYARYEEIGSSIEKAKKAFEISDGHIKRFKSNIEATLKLEMPSDPDSTDITEPDKTPK
ncbi:MAG: DNA recombination protein RmuC [Candidatus Omnitrophica bacterium]|nr:DNA recombination protein RmuC [Candidatus Omnitrophota bacterium]